MILIALDGYHAHYFERMSWVKALRRSGVGVSYYDCKQQNPFDVFEAVKPSVFIGQLYNLDRGTIKCLQERPYIKVALRAGNYSSIEDMMTDPKVLTVTNEELRVLKNLLDETGKPDLIYCHYLQKDMEITHDLFKKEFGVKILGVPMSADLDTYYKGVYNPILECDISFVGGYWPYKGQIIDKYLTPLCFNNNYRIKIFGNQPWLHVNQYCGHISDEHVRDLFASSKVCPNLSEPHSHTYGIDVNERAFKVLAAGGRCIMDNVRAAKEIFGEHVLFADNPSEFKDMIDETIKNPYDTTKSQQFIVDNHSNYHRISLILDELGEHPRAKKVMNAYNHYFQQK